MDTNSISPARHYVSVCSQTYVAHLLAQQLALRALEPAEVVCHVLCMDSVILGLLRELALPGVRPVFIDDFEDAPLLACKAGRTQAEYCWTAKPRFLLHVLSENPDVAEAVYLDADLFPFADLSPLWAQLAEAEVLLFPHRFPQRLQYLEPIAGRYNAGMVGARNTEAARNALAWWAERCLEWCFYQPEDGKLGDQKYLEHLPERFTGVQDCRDEGIDVAPWNIERYGPVERGGAVWLAEQLPLRLYHFHQYTQLGGEEYRAVSDPVYTISPEVRRLIYGPFTAALNSALALIRSVAPEFTQVS